MESFRIAHKFTARWEGGYVNNPADPGGATKYGVSLRWLQSIGHDVNNDGDINQVDIAALSFQEAERLFYEHFWLSQNLDAFDLPFAVCHYDASVNLGIRQASKIVQKTCNMLRPYGSSEQLNVDGCLGPQSVAAVGKLCQKKQGQLAFVQAMLEQRASFYRQLAEKKPGLSIFLNGWLNRKCALWNYLHEVWLQS